MSIYPTVRPSLTLDFQKSKQLDPRISFSRSSSATYVEGGVVKYADEHQARFEKEGLLIEESRTNFLYPSIVPSSTSGLLYVDGAAVTTNAGTAPDGTNTASLVEQASGTGYNRIYFFTGGTVRDESYSFFVKASSPDAVFGFYITGDTSPGGQINYTFSTGTVSGSFPGDVSVEPYPNGWVRLSTTSSVRTTTPSVSFASILNFTGDFFIWGVQREAGSFQTSHIPTSGSEAIRAADVASVAGTNFSSWYNQSEGTFLSQLARLGSPNTGSIGAIIGGSNPNASSSSNHILVGNGNAAISSTGGASYAFALSSTGVHNLVNAYKLNDFNAAYDGNSLTADTSYTPPACTQLVFAGLFPIVSNTGHIARLSYYSRRLTDLELETLTL